jgi:hypothetical protein
LKRGPEARAQGAGAPRRRKDLPEKAALGVKGPDGKTETLRQRIPTMASHTEGPRPAAEERGALEAQLLAVRSELDALASELDASLPPGSSAQARGAAQARGERLARLARELDVLLEWAREPAPRPRLSTLEEILCAARLVLPAELRDRLWLARGAGARPVLLDGPLVAKCLARLARGALSAGAEQVLLSARADAESIVFSVVDRGRVHDGCEIELGLVRRDAALMRGTLGRVRGPKGSMTTLEFPAGRGAGALDHDPLVESLP